MRSRILTALLLTILLPATAVAKSLVASAWDEGGTTVDGAADDWADAMVYLDKARLHMGARNDDHFLYICIYAADPHYTPLALDHGLTLTLKAKGRDPLKIEFPVAGAGQGSGAISPAVLRSPELFVVKGMDGDKDQPFSMENDLGIKLKTGADPEVFTYEFKVPLLPGATNPHAKGGGPGDTIEIRLESPSMALQMMTTEGNGMPDRGNRGTGYGGPAGSGNTLPGDMGMNNQRAALPATFMLKARILLATPPARERAPQDRP
jgi:hypothetical protein